VINYLKAPDFLLSTNGGFRSFPAKKP
jgi:hypothetical protein